MVLTFTALGLGFLHGLGADHLMAIASLAVRPPSTGGRSALTPFQVAVRFALGHAVLLMAGSALVLVVGWEIPIVVEHAGERAGGLILIAMGLFTLWIVVADRLYGHSHGHDHDHHHHAEHVHWHFHLGPRERHPAADAHAHGAGVLGAVFAVSGLRALTLLAPTLHGAAEAAPYGLPHTSASLLTLVYLVSVFAAGILLSMSIFGIVLTRLLGSALVVKAVGRSAAALTAIGSIGLGVYWLSA